MDATLQPSDLARAEEVIRVGDHFYVLAVSSRADDRTRVLKHGETLGIFDRYGDILGPRFGDQGLFHGGTRFLSRLDLSINHIRPLLLSSNLEQENVLLASHLTNPDLAHNGEITTLRGAVYILRTTLVWSGTLRQRLVLRNFAAHAIEMNLRLHFEADYVDMFEVRGVRRLRRGQTLPAALADGRVTLGYVGLDGVQRRTIVECHPSPDRTCHDRMELNVRLEAGAEQTIDVSFACALGDGAPGGQLAATPGFVPALAPAVTPRISVNEAGYPEAVELSHRRMLALKQHECEIHSSNVPFNDWINRSSADLRLMITDTAQGPYPYAGVPWFSTPFGRDGIITALETLWTSPDTARGVLSFLAATQADEVNPLIDAEPGKIVHEIRQGEMAATHEVPYGRYYGSVDATPLFVMLAGEYLRTTGDEEFIRIIWPNIQRALQWMTTPGAPGAPGGGDKDGDGFIEYESAAPPEVGGLNNQGWKDSRDSVFDERGELATPPIALCEVQGYAFAALRDAAEIAEIMGDLTLAHDLCHRADALRMAFAEKFWDEDLGTYVLALDRLKRPCRVAASNAGQCLFTGIARDDHAQRIIRDMLSPRFFSGWGIRTLATDQPRYNPMSYHNGSIWPHDVALIAAGMARHGHSTGAAQLMGAMLDASLFAELHRLPELFCGFERRQGEGPIRYPVACAPQAWAAGAVFLMLQACLGLSIHAGSHEVRCNDPRLPEFLHFVQIRNLRVGTDTADLLFHRRDHDVSVSILRRDPGVRVVVTR
jgi:glycogen debranching enzyme